MRPHRIAREALDAEANMSWWPEDLDARRHRCFQPGLARRDGPPTPNARLSAETARLAGMVHDVQLTAEEAVGHLLAYSRTLHIPMTGADAWEAIGGPGRE